MTKTCVLLAEGFEEIEAITVLDVLRRAQIKTSSVGVSSATVVGAHGISIHSDMRLDEAMEIDWDLIVLPGGQPGADNLRQDEQVQTLIKKQATSGRKIAAICAAPIALARAGVLKNMKATCYPGYEKYLSESQVQQQEVVIDENITTSRGPATALRFSLSLVTQLQGQSQADELAKAMLCD